MTGIAGAREVDLHGMRLYEAETLICETLEEAWYNGEPCVLFVHGFKGGTAIRDFIRKEKGLRAKLKRFFSRLPDVELRSGDRGSTYVLFRK